MLSAVIVGSGFSGICAGILLRKAGIRDFVILEKADRLGGTWRENTYPGAACDVASHLYAYSFEPNPRWSRVYSPQPEIWEYLQRCVDEYGLGPHLRLGVEVASAAFDEASGLWRVHTSGGETLSARVLISAAGGLRLPKLPEIPGLSRFAGKTFHSARWDHGYDLRGKRVAVIGTGASAIQFVPQIAPLVERLSLFQRTPPWILPKPDRAFSEREQRVFARLPALRALYRAALYWTLEARGVGFITEPRLLSLGERLAHRHIRASIQDPELRARVTPDYRMGCKRILLSNDYYPALARPNVEVVTSGIAEIDEGAVVTRDGVRRPVDAILFGTGFDVSAFLAPMRVYGLGGRELSAAWQGGAEAYYGIAVSGFPNLFMLLGPNTGLGHNSIIFMIEAQMHYIMECLRLLKGRRLRYLDVHPAAQRAHNERLQARLEGTIWQSGCKSWYLDENGKNFTLWPHSTIAYWLRTRRVARRDFREVSEG